MSHSGTVRLLVVDGDPMLRQRILHGFEGRAGFTVVATAMGFRTGLPKIQSYHPDILLVDLTTPEVEGIELVEHLRAGGSAVPVLGIVADASDPVRSARARDLSVRLIGRPGAADSSFSPWVDEVCTRASELCPEARALAAAAPSTAVAAAAPAVPTAPAAVVAAATVSSASAPVPRRVVVAETRAPAAVRAAESRPVEVRSVAPPAATTGARCRVRRAGRSAIEVIGIGVSTGGPKALSVLLPMLPKDLAVPVLIVQHMPPVFTASLAESLSRQCALPVREARAGEPVLPGQVLIAPGGKHMRLVHAEANVVVRITEDPPENSCRPAVDYLFRSLGEIYGAGTLAVMMTGMGEDGFAACRQLHALGATIFAQDAASCTVYGMPRGPIEAGIVDVVAPLEQLAGRIIDVVQGVSR